MHFYPRLFAKCELKIISECFITRPEHRALTTVSRLALRGWGPSHFIYLRTQRNHDHYITTHSQTPIFCIVSRVDKRYL